MQEKVNAKELDEILLNERTKPIGKLHGARTAAVCLIAFQSFCSVLPDESPLRSPCPILLLNRKRTGPIGLPNNLLGVERKHAKKHAL
jgi:hypothetical protein